MRFLLLLRPWIISISLAGAAVFFGYQTFEIWSAKDKLEVNKPARKPPRPRAQRRVAYRLNPGYNTYEVIAQRNLFSSDRREKLPEKPPTPLTPLPVKPPKSLDRKFALFGIFINGHEKKALVSNFDKKRKKGKKYIWVKVGDTIGDLNISEIQSKGIILTQGDSSYTIRLSDHSHPHKRAIMQKAIKRTGNATKYIRKPKVKSPAKKGSKPSS